MKVLHFGCAYKPYRGGSRVRLEQLVTRIHTKEVQLSLITHILSKSHDDNLPFCGVLRTANANSMLPSLKILRFIRAQDPSVVILHNSRVLLIWLFFYRFIFPKIGVVCELHSVRETTRIKSFINALLYRCCDQLVVLSTGAKNWVNEHYGLSNAISIVNGTDLRLGSSVLNRPDYNPLSVHYVYAGSFHDWQGVVVLAEAVHQLGVKFWRHNRLTLVGGGPAFNEVRKRIGSEILALDTVRIMEWCDSETVRHIQLEADFLLAPRPSTVATETVVPLKVVDSVTLARPLIASYVGGLTEFLSGADNTLSAVFVKPGDVLDLIRAMKYPPDTSDYALMYENLIALREKIPSWEQSAITYENLLREVALR